MIDNFIGIFPNAVSKNFCEEVIQHFEYLQSIRKVFSRYETENEMPSINKDNSLYYLLDEKDSQIVPRNAPIISQFFRSSLNCYKEYVREYGVLSSLQEQSLSYSVKIQKTQPSEGYHIWHCEHGSVETGPRLLMVQLFLNTVEEGGETEFLYQRKRVKAEQGTLLISPAAYTHTHRGNPPLSGNKYTMNSWVEFTK